MVKVLGKSGIESRVNVEMKLRNKGAYFVRTRANEIFTVVYFKTNYVNTKLPKSRRLEPGKVSIAFFDKKGADYVSNPVSYADLIGGIEEDMKDVYDFNDYINADEMYDAMKKDRLMKDYKKELFEKRYAEARHQLEIL